VLAGVSVPRPGSAQVRPPMVEWPLISIVPERLDWLAEVLPRDNPPMAE